MLSLLDAGEKALTVDFNLGLQPQRFVFGDTSWSGGGWAGAARECGRAASAPGPLPRPLRRALRTLWARPRSFHMC